MRYLFLLNPTAGKRDCTAELAPAIQAAAQRAGMWAASTGGWRIRVRKR